MLLLTSTSDVVRLTTDTATSTIEVHTSYIDVSGATVTPGRTNTRIKGWLGRADQTAKVRGMFVHPSQVAEVLKRHPELGRARLVVAGEMAADTMTLRVEAGSRPTGLAEAVATSVREVTKLRAEIELVEPGSLPNDGKVIEDARSYR